VGASTIAANTSVILSKMPGARAFLGDFDMGSGIIGFIFKLAHGYSLRDALHNVHEMDEALWTRLAVRVDDLDILPAGCELEPHFDHERVRHLIDHLRRVYTVSCLDLPGQIDAHSMEVLRESNKIYLVCTQELTCLHVLRRKVELLGKMGLDGQLQVLVNRYDKNNPMNLARIEEVAQGRVALSLPNQYKQSLVGTEVGTNTDRKGPLWKAFEAVAHNVAEIEPPARPRGKRFLEHFALWPGTRNCSAEVDA
jgi:pilus assembly protein CpaE